jgi:hypothetical protein
VIFQFDEIVAACTEYGGIVIQRRLSRERGAVWNGLRMS